MPRQFSDPASPDIAALEALLAAELGDAAVARAFAEIVVADVLQWKPPLVAPKEVQTIVAYTFGNRFDANGNRSPGPVNAALADVAVRLHEETGAPVYAQWEIAEAIGSRIASAAPRLDHASRGMLGRRRSTCRPAASAAAIVETCAAIPGELGKVAVVGFADHIKRCVDTSRRAGMDAAAPAGYDMPTAYDAQLGPALDALAAGLSPSRRVCRIEDRRIELIAGG